MHAAAMKPMTLSYRDFDPQFVEDETNGRIEKIKKENEELARLGKPLKNIPEFVSRAYNFKLGWRVNRKESLKGGKFKEEA